jgi:hypothetical protein
LISSSIAFIYSGAEDLFDALEAGTFMPFKMEAGTLISPWSDLPIRWGIMAFLVS